MKEHFVSSAILDFFSECPGKFQICPVIESGCKRLKTIKVSTKKLVNKNVGNKAFARIDPKAAVKVPASCLESYKKLLRKKGLNGKKQKIKK